LRDSAAGHAHLVGELVLGDSPIAPHGADAGANGGNIHHALGLRKSD
jgi:hypothetical protein